MRMVVVELAHNANHSLPPGDPQCSRIRRNRIRQGTSGSRDRTLVAEQTSASAHRTRTLRSCRPTRCGPTLAGMATESTMLALGTPAPLFALPEPATGATVSLDELTGPALVVTFICNHCPYVQHVAAGLAALGRDLTDQGVAMVGISSNDVVTYPQDGPDQMVAQARRHGWTFPYLYDETQDVARAFSAACTPDTFVFDGERRLVYRGQLDDSRPRNDLPVTAADVRAAVDAVLAGRPVDPDQRPSIGCGIKWR
jgi:peroxiredoxin